MYNDNLLESFVEVYLKEKDDFLKVRETLTRIGIASKKSNTLYQSCHILHKKGRYYIVHFKELFELDGKNSNYDIQDIGRRNTIANLLFDWGLVILANPEQTINITASMYTIKVIPHSEKRDWKLVSKYSIGKPYNNKL